ncbi:amidohydrolase family protein [Pseudorhodoferax sp. Leaf265]|uniref:amidohydrolase family protein n=1 Tax=Pseudorhodoferax sp. Leaf265 TaxID=1736315 RepID=UPI0006FE1EAB|nr:amidohydrolase family protein [Pseudorhodoferax sp. Leaf265]KQP05351.1 hydrolase [Pseudorhodoferax sp. Leaf265]
MHDTIDQLLTDLTVVTVDAQMRVLKDAGVAIRGGRIAWVGPMAELPAELAPLPRQALPGRVLTPGFVNVHTHAILSMVRGVAEDLGFAPAYTPGIPHGHDVTPDEAVALARLGAVEALLFGSTLVNDTYVHADLTLPAMAEIGGRVYSCGRIHDADFSLIGDGRWEHHDAIGERTLDEALALASRWHGAFDGRTGVQLSAHAPDTCSDALLARIGEAARRHGLRVNTHLAQSRKEVAQVLARSGRTPAQLLEDTGLLNDELVAAHCLFLDEADIARCGRAGIHVAHIPKGNATGGTAAPTSALRRAGAALTLGTDNMHADMVEVLRWALAIGRIQEDGVDDFWQPEDVLRMGTMGGARAMGLAEQVGSIEVGKQADLVAFDFRRAHLVPCVKPVGNLVHTAQGRDVEHVWVAGRQVVASGRPTQVDLEQILADAQRAADALWRRARGG